MRETESARDEYRKKNKQNPGDREKHKTDLPPAATLHREARGGRIVQENVLARRPGVPAAAARRARSSAMAQREKSPNV